MGAMLITEACNDLEHAAQTNDVSNIRTSAKRLEAAVHSTMQALSKISGDDPVGSR